MSSSVHLPALPDVGAAFGRPSAFLGYRYSFRRFAAISHSITYDASIHADEKVCFDSGVPRGPQTLLLLSGPTAASPPVSSLGNG